MHSVTASYLSSACGTAPYAVYAEQNGDCEEESCSETGSSDGESESSTVQCSADYLQAMRDAFAGWEYILQEVFSDDTCSTFEYAVGFLVTDTCTGGAWTYDYYYTSNITDIGRASIQIFQNADGSSSAGDSSCMYRSVEVDAARDQLERHTCLIIDSDIALYDLYGPKFYNGMAYKWYSNNDKDESGLSTGAVAGIVCGSVAVLLIGTGSIVFYRRNLKGKRGKKLSSTVLSGDVGSLEAVVGSQTGLWNDDVIVAKRIPRDKVHVKNLISRGAYGEVYSGRFNRILLPSRC